MERDRSVAGACPSDRTRDRELIFEHAR
jgi:hypothetical protein